MPRRLRLPRLGSLALLPLLGAALVSCERRIEEPISSPPGQEASALRGRCVKPTPAEPRRTTPRGPDPRCPRDDEPQPPKLRLGKVTFLPDAAKNTADKEIPIEVEIAEREHDRQRGLMFRTQMPDTHGMIFFFSEKTDHSFWMHNTCIPLDMLFIDDDGLIVGIEENTPTLNDDTYSVGCPSQYVLEVNAGWTRAHGVKAGQSVKIEL